jgi:hypothetical protein
MPCESNPRLGEDDPGRRCVNLRAEFCQALADAFERDQVEGLTDEATIGQLAGLLYELDSQGRTKIESKEKARARGVSSPDRADALMLALCRPYQKFEFQSIRDHQQRRSKSAGPDPRANPYWGFEEVSDDNEDDLALRLGPRRWPRGRVAW